jgi:PadR family transcriptional regulator PadR
MIPVRVAGARGESVRPGGHGREPGVASSRSLWAWRGGSARSIWPYILNYVKHIQDYYAPVIGEFEQLVLLSLVRLGNGAYGATIRRDIRDRTGRDAAIGTVYMTLARLEEKQMIVSYIGNPSPHRGGRRRKHYLIDTAGQKALGRSYRTFKAMSAGIEAELEAL